MNLERSGRWLALVVNAAVVGGVVLLAASGVESGEVASEPPNQGDPVQLARDFFGASDRAENVDELFSAWMGVLSEDCRYETPGQVLAGRQEIATRVLEQLKAFGFVRVVIDLKHVAASGNVVLFERVDHHLRADGSDLVVPIAGSLEIRDGKVARWRDYYDTAPGASAGGGGAERLAE